MNRLLTLASSAAVLGLTACVTMPAGPTTMALPGRHKTFEQFQIDDARCRGYATAQIGGPSAAENANNSAVASAVLGTAIGAAAGAAIGGNGSAAGVGAGMGLLAGSAMGAGAAQTSYYATQQRFDAAYTQCMYAAGNQVAVNGRYARRYQQPQAPAYPPPNAPPPPDAGVPPDYRPPGNMPPAGTPPPR